MIWPLSARPASWAASAFDSVAEDVLAWHEYGYPESETSKTVKLETWGIYKSRRGGELHEWSPQVVQALTAAVRAESEAQRLAEYKGYADMVNQM